MELKIEQALQKAVEAHRLGKLQDAEKAYRVVLKLQPKHAVANHNLGMLSVSVNNPGAAILLLKTALEANPQQVQFWLSYIDVLIKEKQIGSAKNVLEQGRKFGLVGEKIDALEEELNQFFREQQTESDKKQSSPSVDLQKNISTKNSKNKNASAHQQNFNPIKNLSQTEINRLLEAYQKGQYELAQKLARSVTQKFPKYALGWKVLGAVLKQTGKLHESLTANEKTLRLAPKDPEIHNNLGIIMCELGRFEDAETSYRNAIALNPTLAEIHSNLGNTLQKIGRLEEAQISYGNAIALKPTLPEVHSNLGNTLQKLGRFEEAQTSYRQAILLKPDHAEAYYNLGITLEKLGRLEESEISYKNAIAVKPNYADAHNNLGNIFQKLRRLGEAEASYRYAIATKSDYAEAHYNLGNNLQKIYRFEHAETSYRNAIALKPGYAEAYNNLGLTLQELGKLEDAETSYRKAIALKPDYADAFWNLSTERVFSNEIDDATTYLEKLLLIDPNDHGLKAAVDLAILRYLDEDWVTSKELLLSCSSVLEKEISDFENSIIYWTYLCRLLDWHEKKLPGSPNEAAAKKLYVIGESHALGSHRLRVETSRGIFSCKSLWIVGCKQWHLGSTARNKYKHKSEAVVRTLPPESELLLAIGEIDCRSDAGILKHHQKYPEKSKSDLIAVTVKNYLDFILKTTSPYSHKVTIQGVPCPNIDRTSIPEQSIDELTELIRDFNAALQNQSTERGFNFLDVHQLTDRGDGFSNAIWHLDTYHLSPDGMLEAWRKHHSQSLATRS